MPDWPHRSSLPVPTPLSYPPLHPMEYILPTASYTLHLTSYILHPTPYTLRSTSYLLRPTPILPFTILALPIHPRDSGIGLRLSSSRGSPSQRLHPTSYILHPTLRHRLTAQFFTRLTVTAALAVPRTCTSRVEPPLPQARTQVGWNARQ